MRLLRVEHGGILGIGTKACYGTGALAPVHRTRRPKIDPLVHAVRAAITEEKRRTALSDIQHFLHGNGGDLIYARAPIVALADNRVRGVRARGHANSRASATPSSPDR